MNLIHCMNFSPPPHNCGNLIHLLGERFVHNMDVVECQSGIRMAKHLRHILQLYIIRQRDCRSKCIARAIFAHFQLLRNTLNGYMVQKEKRRILLKYSVLTNLSFFSSGATGIRTRDTRIFSPLLYQLSYGTFLRSQTLFLSFGIAKVDIFSLPPNFF